MSSAFYFITVAIVFVVAAVAVLAFAKIKMKDRHHSVEEVMIAIFLLLVLSFGWFFTIPVLFIAGVVYFSAKGISKWLNK